MFNQFIHYRCLSCRLFIGILPWMRIHVGEPLGLINHRSSSPAGLNHYQPLSLLHTYACANSDTMITVHNEGYLLANIISHSSTWLMCSCWTHQSSPLPIFLNIDARAKHNSQQTSSIILCKQLLVYWKWSWTVHSPQLMNPDSCSGYHHSQAYPNSYYSELLWTTDMGVSQNRGNGGLLT